MGWAARVLSVDVGCGDMRPRACFLRIISTSSSTWGSLTALRADTERLGALERVSTQRWDLYR